MIVRLNYILLAVATLPAIGYANSGPVEHPPLQVFGSGEIIRALLMLALFITIAISIATRRLPAMIALPLMALGIGIIAGVPLFGDNGILLTILEGKTAPNPTGAFRFYQPIIYILLGGMFARFINDARIAERIVKYAAEYGGENPFTVALLMSAISIIIFTAVGGLPMIIMLGTVMFPILLSLGVPPTVCGAILLLAFPIGASLNPVDWMKRVDLYEISYETVRKFFLIWAGLQVIVLLTFLSIEFLKMKRTTVTPRSIVISVVQIAFFTLIVFSVLFLEVYKTLLPGLADSINTITSWRDQLGRGLQFATLVIVGYGVISSQWQYHKHKQITTEWNLLTPVLPIIFLLGLDFDLAIVPAFMASIAYGFFTTPGDRSLPGLSRSMMNGIADVAAPVVLMIGIGMLIAAATHPNSEKVLNPVLTYIVPTSATGYVVFFLLAAPLALYRGPLNEFGLGLGVARLLQSILPKPAVMGALMSAGMLQDPTTTQNVWICGFLKLDINALLFKLFWYSISLVLSGLLLSVWLFF